MRFLILMALLFPIAAFAQAQSSSGEQALGAKLMQEIQGGLNCSAGLIDAQNKLEIAKARIKELEAKIEEGKPK